MGALQGNLLAVKSGFVHSQQWQLMRTHVSVVKTLTITTDRRQHWQDATRKTMNLKTDD
jgi:hypothetical protein